ncbi:hypothetical protein ACFFSW_17710 [Saccharothrix longispora]|uniref:Helix-turn-helix protein n=1 Tax=Saccharothrix longispora TaxID=33920 RepID=A0ABU1PSG0_9PSEU|nr:hypothetical protein [Saccharothrix longispora]MDR6593587.1 hypothetical protein [Saccharothrix longispora]
MGNTEPVRRCICGTRLARDNRTSRCGACTHAGRRHRTEPPEVPIGFWDHPDLRAALATRDIGAIIRAYRKHPHHGQSILQETVACWIGLSSTRLSRIENGEPVNNLAKLSRWSHTLRIPQHLLWFHLPTALRDDAASGTPTIGGRETPGDALPVDDPLVLGGRSMAVRSGDEQQIDLQALMSAAAQHAVDFGSVLATTTTDNPDLDWLGVALAELATAYVHTPAVDLLVRIVDVRDTAFTLIRRGVRPRQLRDAYVIAGIGCLLLASASQNLGDHSCARTQLHTAERCAEAADSDALRVWARGSAALALEWSPTPAAALRFVDFDPNEAVGPQTMRRTLALEARASARTGNATRARDALRRLDELEALPERHDEVSVFGGLFTFPTAKETYYRAGTHDLLGDAALARHHADHALAAYSTAPEQERSYGDIALARVVLAHSHLLDRDLDAAATALQPLRRLPPGERIAQLPSAVHRTHGLLTAVAGARHAHELLDDLLEAPAAARSLDSRSDRTAP